MYQRVGVYRGPIEALAEVAAAFEVAWAPDGHGTTTEHLIMIRDAFRPYAGRVIPGEWAASMLVALKPGGNIPQHHDLPQMPGLCRYHLVLQTNPRCWNFHGGAWQQLELGGVYTVDPMVEHASINWGDTDRIHLVVDAVGG